MDVREKLVELIINADSDKNLVCYDLYDLTHEGTGCAKYFADYLIDNGVTVQEWISVEDRLPNEMGTYLVCTNKGGIVMAHWYGDRFGGGYASKKVTHWMPLPQPPKGE